MTAEPLLLAFDTSTSTGSVGVGRGTHVLAQEEIVEERAQASGLVPRIESVLESAGVGRRELSGVVVGRGPGSFTGVRVAAATARGLTHGLGIPLWGVSSLAAAALSGGGSAVAAGTDADRELVDANDPRPRFVLFDARSDRVYAACYRLSPEGAQRIGSDGDPGSGGLDTLVEPIASVLDTALEWAPEGAVFCGDAALRHERRIRAAGFTVAAPPLGVPTAAGILRARVSLERGPLAKDWEPEYLRASSARPPARAGGPS